MKTVRLFVFLLLALPVISAALFIIAAAEEGRARTYPEGAVVFYDHRDRTWCRYTYGVRLHAPLTEQDFTPRLRRMCREILGYDDTPSGRYALALRLAPHLLRLPRHKPWYYAARLADYAAAFWLYCRYSTGTVLLDLLNHRPAAYRVIGVKAMIETVTGTPLDRLENGTLKDYLRVFFHRSEALVPPTYDRVRLILKDAVTVGNTPPPYGGHLRDYCLAVMRREGLFKTLAVYHVYTTVRPNLQRVMEETIPLFFNDFSGQSEIQRRILLQVPEVETAAIILDHRRGAILAMLGGRRYGPAGRYNRCTQARRQISSTFKPFLYAAAVDRLGYTGTTPVVDRPVMMSNRDGSAWQPGNFYPYYTGETTLHKALVVSINTVAVQLIQDVGVKPMAELTRRIFRLRGNAIKERVRAEPSLSLGSIDLTPYELAKGYLMLANLGREMFPYGIRRVTDGRGRTVYRGGPRRGRRLYRPQSAAMVRTFMKDVIREGTAAEFLPEDFAFDVAGKTGSSAADSWLAGFSPERVIVTWAGYDDPALGRRESLPLFTVVPYWFHLMLGHPPRRKQFRSADGSD